MPTNGRQTQPLSGAQRSRPARAATPGLATWLGLRQTSMGRFWEMGLDSVGRIILPEFGFTGWVTALSGATGTAGDSVVEFKYDLISKGFKSINFNTL